MRKTIIRNSRRGLSILLVSFSVVLALSALSAGIGQKQTRNAKTNPNPNATPPSGSLGPTGTAQNWSGTVVAANVIDETACIDGVNCDTYTLTLTGNPIDWANKKARVQISWNFGVGDDFDVVVHKGSNSGPIVGSAINSSTNTPEIVDVDPNAAGVGTGVFTVHVIYFLALPGDTYNGSASVTGGVPTPTPTPSGTPTPTPLPSGVPRYFTYHAPAGTGESAGEPSVGSNWLSENIARAPGQTFANSNGTVFNGGTATYYGGFLSEMLRITFDDCSSPANDSWEKKQLFLAATPRAVGDPILFTDHGYPARGGLGRTFVMQEESQAGATTDVTDDDGETFQPSMGAGAPAGVDHETTAAGPYALPVPVTNTYPAPSPNPNPRAVYYASQSVSDARCSRSDNGGITFLPAVPMFTVADCDGLHGHLKVAPDGTVYVPDKQCSVGGVPILLGGNASVIASEDNGVTWNIRPIPGSAGAGYGEFDPSVGIATDGTIYLGYQGTDGHARIAVSHNKGVTWSTPVDVGISSASVTGPPVEGIRNCAFPAVVAGDPDRAAFAFYGTTTADGPGQDHSGGSNNDPAAFTGVWYLYIATTFDGGQHWITQNVTPNDPVQRGPICGDSTCRNLLDFFDATIDKRGRVLVGWDDGCIGGCVNGGPNSFTAKAVITRQSGGKRMFNIFDPMEPAVPGAPKVSGFLNAAHTAIELSWPQPDNGGANITAYKIYRRKASEGTFTLRATTNVPSYQDDSGFDPVAGNNFYHVTAVNSVNEGPYCSDFVPSAVPPPTPCILPGLLAIDDINADGTDHDSGQNTPVDGSVNIKQLFVAEPFVSAGVEELDFTLQVAPSTLGSAPANSQWFIIWNRQGTDATDPNDAKYDRMYVAMKTDASGTPTFEYGKFGLPINTSPPPPPDPAANTPQKFGDADSGSYDPLTGLIKIKISNSKLRAIDANTPVTYKAGSDLAGLNIRTYFNRPDPGQRSQNNASDISDDSSYSLVGNNSCAPAAQLVSAVSRKVHGAAGPFDIKLVPTGPDGGIECRSGGAGGNYQVVMVFASPVTFSSATVNSGSVSNTSTSNNIVTVNLSGITVGPQVVTVTLVGATAGATPVNVSVPMRLIVGDVNASNVVNSTDVSETKAESGHAVDDENFRNDVNANGQINSSDVSTVKAKSGTGLP